MSQHTAARLRRSRDIYFNERDAACWDKGYHSAYSIQLFIGYKKNEWGRDKRKAAKQNLLRGFFKVGRTGVEPVTLGLKVPCSTN